jgi:hypothetical protein
MIVTTTAEGLKRLGIVITRCDSLCDFAKGWCGSTPVPAILLQTRADGIKLIHGSPNPNQVRFVLPITKVCK